MNATYKDVLNSVHSLKQDERFRLYIAYLREMFEHARQGLETADQTFRQQQGRVACLREQIHMIDTAAEISELIGQSGESPDPTQ